LVHTAAAANDAPAATRARPRARAVVHDLKNLLAAVAGHVSLALAEVTPGTPLADALSNIEVGVRRTAELA